MRRTLLLAPLLAAVLAGPAHGQAPTNWEPPFIVGTSPPGIDCELGDWEGVTTFRLEWLRDGTVARTDENVLDASRYPLTSADVGRTFVCRVTGTSDEGSTTATSQPVVIRAAVQPSPPRIGLTVVGQFLDEVIPRGLWLSVRLDKPGVVRLKINVAGRRAAAWRVSFPSAGGGTQCRSIKLSRTARAALRKALRAKRAVTVVVRASAVGDTGVAAKPVTRRAELR